MDTLIVKTGSDACYQPGTWQVPAKEIIRVLRVFGRNIGASFTDYSTLCFRRGTYEVVI